MDDLLAAGNRDQVQPWARIFAEGHGNHWGGVTTYLSQHEGEWARALRLTAVRSGDSSPARAAARCFGGLAARLLHHWVSTVPD